MITPTIFDSFNARSLGPAEVARGFIPPQHFDKLILQRHTVVIGPRGSGKTTLLKMLQIPALAHWQHPEAQRFRGATNFIGVFVPADISWSAQVQCLAGGELHQSAREKLGAAAFVTHALTGFADAMAQASAAANVQPGLEHIVRPLERTSESKLISAIAEAWQLSIAVPSFAGLKIALRKRLSLIAQIANREAGREASAIDEALYKEAFLSLPFLESITSGVEIFNASIQEPDQKWALLFDELEIAPAHIRNSLFAALRSTDDRLLFKLSISPYSADLDVVKQASGAAPYNDYDPIYLWYMNKERSYEFTKSLCNSILAQLSSEKLDVERAFEPSGIEEPENFSRNARATYAPGGRLYRTFKDLASTDESFRFYLRRRNINLEAIAELPEDERAQTIRKVTPIVAARHAYLAPIQRNDGARTLRSRKRYLPSGGPRTLFAIVEGNPRWIIGILGPLLKAYAERRRPVSLPKQSAAIATATQTFRSMLKTIPFQSDDYPSHRGVLSFLDSIGDYLFDRVVRDDFDPEPPLSFIVHSTASASELEALGKALNAGALVGEESSDQPIIGSLRGKRLRLSYMLAAYHGLPLLLGRSLSLNQIFGPKPEIEAPNQPKLF